MLGDPTQAVKDSMAVFCPSLYHCSFHMINCKILKRKLKNNFKINFKGVLTTKIKQKKTF